MKTVNPDRGYGPKSMASAEPTAVSPVVLRGPIYVPSSSFNISSVAEEPSFAAAAAPVVSVPAMLDALTARQRDVLDLIVQGMSNKEIARALKLAEGTVKIHVTALFRKFGLYRRAAVAVMGAQLLSLVPKIWHGR